MTINSLIMSCETDNAPSLCLGVEVEPNYPGISKKMTTAGLDPNDPKLVIVEKDDGTKL